MTLTVSFLLLLAWLVFVLELNFDSIMMNCDDVVMLSKYDMKLILKCAQIGGKPSHMKILEY